MAPLFGPGVNDVKVHYTRYWWDKIISEIWFMTHNGYWKEKCDPSTIKSKKEYETIGNLYSAMRLDDIAKSIYK